ncbi:hypothetical protein [Bacillus sp. NPDC094077]|uniref:hypothetical protein n=1 Tax=Bacillus sp. NPDC094077 TaxID=3390932 RepID=UPI003D061D3F
MEGHLISLLIYQKEGVAFINKCPTSVEVLKSKDDFVLIEFYEAKSIVDNDKAEIIKARYLTGDILKEHFICLECSMENDHFYNEKKNITCNLYFQGNRK